MENLWIFIYFDGIFVVIGLLGCVWRESGFDDSGLGVCVVYDYENVVVVGVFVNKVFYGVLYNRVVVRKVVFVGWKFLMELDIVFILWVFLGFNVGILLKEFGIEYWLVGGGIDFIGFFGVGGGYRGVDGFLFNDF